LGLHPWVADEPISLSQLADQLRAPKMVAIGEIGLDFALPKFNHNQQLNILREQLELAIKLDFPVLLHCRGAFEELLQLLQDYAPNLRGVIHAFSKGAELARRFIDLGFHIAFGGAITRPHATKARQSAASIALERLVLETDAPSIGLDGISPEAVEPCHIATIGESLAQLRNGSLEDIAMKTTENARALFNLP
jgi:TatD DNase family protein